MRKSPAFTNPEGFALDDLDCRLCLHYQAKEKSCFLESCCCAAEKQKALKRGQVKLEATKK